MLLNDLAYKGASEDIAIVDQERRFTYRELQEQIALYRNYLYEEGIRQGDRVGIFSRNSAEYIFSYFAIISLGAIAVPINFQLSSREVAYIIKDAGIKHIMTYKVLDLNDAMVALRCHIVMKQHDIKKCVKGKKSFPEAPVLSEDFGWENPCAIIYTSGTTGNPKGAVLSHKNLVRNSEQFKRLKCTSDCNVLCVLPMYHCFGWTTAVLYSLHNGATIVILDSFNPKETIQVIRNEKITDMYVVPSICSILTKMASKEDMANLRIIVSGGTTLAMKLQEDFIAKFGVSICEGYGLSEASPVVSVNPPEKVKTGSIGPLLDGIQWRLVDVEGKDVPPGELGELVIKGDNVMLGYWNLPEATDMALRNGWLHTGDIARCDEDEYFYIVDRIKDMIISMGENIYPREVEEVIYQFPGINTCAVIGVDDKIRGQAGACFYTVQDGQTVNTKELKKFLQNNLALYKVPREFHEMEFLPMTNTGKIAKRMILAAFEEQKNKK